MLFSDNISGRLLPVCNNDQELYLLFLSKEKVTDEFRIDISDASYGIVYDNKKPDENPDLNILTDIVLQHIKNLIIRR